MSDNLFGILTNYKMPGEEKTQFNLVAKAFKWPTVDDGIDLIELKVENVHSYRVHDWDNDSAGGPGLCIYVEFETPNGKPYMTEVVIPKDELIKALALLVDEQEQLVW